MGSAQSKIEEPGKQPDALVRASTAKSPGEKVHPVNQYSLTFSIAVPSVSLHPRTYYDNSPLSTFVSAASRAMRRQPDLGYFRFLDLPPEIRSIIYEEVLVVGRVFYTPDDHEVANSYRYDHRGCFRKPELQILRVCKQIHSEAEPVYLSKNMFVLPLNWNMHPPLNVYRERHRRSIFSAAGLAYVRNINLAFDPRIQSDFKGFGSNFWGYVRGLLDARPLCPAFSRMSSAERLLEMHDYSGMWLGDSWYGIFFDLRHFESTMDHVEVDFTNAFCLVGDCRPLHLTHIETLLDTAQPSNIDVYGLLTRAEQLSVIEQARFYGYTYEQLKKGYNLQFRKSNEGSPWDRWMIREPDRRLFPLEEMEGDFD